MITLEQMKQEDYDWFKLSKEDKKEATRLMLQDCLDEEKGILEKAVLSGFFPQKYLKDRNRFGCQIII
jgi:hypothetical protein